MVNYPINPEIMESYRKQLLVGSCPSLFNTDTPITPTIDITPTGSLGHANYVGVGAVSIFDDIFTVPANEEWTVIGFSILKMGVMTIGSCSLNFRGFIIGGTNLSMPLASIAPPVYSYIFPRDFICKTGDRLIIETDITAWTSGNYQVSLMYYKRIIQ